MHSNLSLLGAFVFLAIGVIIQAVLQQFVYPLLSRSHERAKAIGGRGLDPVRAMQVMRIVNFLLLPLVGFLAGGMIFNR